ncbi:putative boron transporter [Clavispora lusitaniae]|uniref:Boron transporter n=1 Tax=Clavispora lusitaniae TaxID=36911 RepID=A0ACD0WFA7_CLALS|nr:HCO3- transporter family protein [Clavispora lusitaniae]QFZ26066.1 putative boron transporter [Clavispora lusitaniae]QFZ30631.1 putative boron transporter [Clavispora lusitaniae]QFZ36299.1 putative boron transporter [Clavispora lusitaniae]QFZ41983.1 putative boron transporter [Clavispora lusitaniae]
MYVYSVISFPKSQTDMLRFFKSLGRGVIRDIRNRWPHYGSDFSDAYDYRVIPSTIYIFFTNLLPAIAFAQDMFDRTNNSYGVNEVLMSSALAGVVFGLLAGQPLCIVGVTGPIAIFSYTVYELMHPRGTPYFPFMCWIYLWSMVMHVIVAMLNWVSFLRIISNFSCEVFGFFINIVYCQKAVQILDRQFAEVGVASGFCSVTIALLMVIFGLGSSIFGSQLHYFKPWCRKFFLDYGVPLGVIFFTGFIHFGGYLDNVHLAHLPTTGAFQPTARGPERPHGWFIHFWPKENIDVGDVFLAIPYAILLTFLFYFDHNVSSLMCQSKDYPLKKPASFHWDFMLLGITTGISGILGIPAPNGLIPQAPLHTSSLVVHDLSTGKPLSVVEQRLTNTLQGAMTFVMMSGPFLTVLGLIPQAVLAGLFLIMGIGGLHGSPVVNKIRFIFLDKDYITHDPECPQMWKDLNAIPPSKKKWFYVYLGLQVIAGLAEFIITLTKGAVGFPGVLMFFALCAKWVWPKIIPPEDLEYLDGAVAEEFIVKSLEVPKLRPEKQHDSEMDMISSSTERREQ